MYEFCTVLTLHHPFSCLLQSAHPTEANRGGCKCLMVSTLVVQHSLDSSCGFMLPHVRTVLPAGCNVEAAHSSLSSRFAGKCQLSRTAGEHSLTVGVYVVSV